MKSNVSTDAAAPELKIIISRPITHAPTAAHLGWALEAAGWGRLDALEMERMGRHCATPQALLAQACHDLGLAPPQTAVRPAAARLPMLCRIESRGWGVVEGLTPSGLWVTRFESGFAHFAELALRNACFFVPEGPPDAPALHPPEHSEDLRAGSVGRGRNRQLAVALCGPAFPLNWENFRTMACLAAAVVLVWALLKFGRKLFPRVARFRWRTPSRWLEAQQLARQLRRIQRQSIVSKPDSDLHPYRPARGRRDGHRST